jgi:hypothetical protein
MMMTDYFFNDSEIAELLFALVLIMLGIGMLVVRETRRAPRSRAMRQLLRAAGLVEPCTHPAWRAISLPVRGTGQALKICCFRCGAPALDRFRATACSTASCV